MHAVGKNVRNHAERGTRFKTCHEEQEEERCEENNEAVGSYTEHDKYGGYEHADEGQHGDLGAAVNFIG